jgi:hypothetical protein
MAEAKKPASKRSITPRDPRITGSANRPLANEMPNPVTSKTHDEASAPKPVSKGK